MTGYERIRRDAIVKAEAAWEDALQPARNGECSYSVAAAEACRRYSAIMRRYPAQTTVPEAGAA
jgi:hypothetical protein